MHSRLIADPSFSCPAGEHTHSKRYLSTRVPRGFRFHGNGPDPTVPCRVQLEGGTVMFMSLELHAPSIFGLRRLIPAPESDT